MVASLMLGNGFVHGGAALKRTAWLEDEKEGGAAERT